MADGGGFENRCGVTPTGGSNPSPSASPLVLMRSSPLGVYTFFRAGKRFRLERVEVMPSDGSSIAPVSLDLPHSKW